jgi:hypothetical protein
MKKGQAYNARIRIVHPKLLSWMGMPYDADIYHDVPCRSY